MLRLGESEMAVSLAEMQAHVRIETGEEEAILASMIRTATAQCETFIGQTLMERAFSLDVRATKSGWTLLSLQPVRSLSAVRLQSDGQPLPSADYRVDLDHDGRCWISGLPVGVHCIVDGVTGSATTPNEVAPPLRHGIIRMAAHLFASRDGEASEMPTVVTALWRPYRRARLR